MCNRGRGGRALSRRRRRRRPPPPGCRRTPFAGGPARRPIPAITAKRARELAHGFSAKSKREDRKFRRFHALMRPSPEESARKSALGLKEARRSRIGDATGAMASARRREKGFSRRRRRRGEGFWGGTGYPFQQMGAEPESP